MKRIYILVLSALLACLLVLPVSASELNFPSLPSDAPNYTYGCILENKGTTYYYLTSERPIVDSSFKISWSSSNIGNQYKLENNNWVISLTGFSSAMQNATGLKWSNYDIYSTSGSVYFEGDLDNPLCNGSSCPATDADHNNICDDCGLVLTYSLRSSLLDYAKSTAQGWFPDYSYFAVVESLIDSSYVVYISETPMYANPPDYDTVYGTSMRWFSVSENEDGSFSHSGNASISSWGGTLIYSNHDIENFQTPPLAVVIQGVTGEALKVELPNLMTEVRTIVVLAVGCLALLILLVVLVRALRNFSRS